jgi:predicted AlkP superfamily pyrophosphatase or phosphodiesterase
MHVMSSSMNVAHISTKIWGVLGILAQKYVSFIFYIFKCFVWCENVVWDFSYSTYLRDSRNLILN